MFDHKKALINKTRLAIASLAVIFITFKIFTQNIDSKLDYKRALINKTGRALHARANPLFARPLLSQSLSQRFA